MIVNIVIVVIIIVVIMLVSIIIVVIIMIVIKIPNHRPQDRLYCRPRPPCSPEWPNRRRGLSHYWRIIILKS